MSASVSSRPQIVCSSRPNVHKDTHTHTQGLTHTHTYTGKRIISFFSALTEKGINRLCNSGYDLHTLTHTYSKG